MCRFFTSLAILAVVSTAKAADDCCLTSGDSSSCPEGKTFIDDVDTYDADTGNTYTACCAGGNIELETMLENLNMCGSDVQTASTTDENGDEETTTTTTGSGGINLQNEDCCTPEGTDCPIQMPNPISAAEAREAGGIICCEDGVSQMNMGKDLPMSCAALAAEEATDGAEVEVMDEDTTTTTTTSGGSASDCCLIASDSSCPDGKTYMGKFIIVIVLSFTTSLNIYTKYLTITFLLFPYIR